MKEVAAVSVCVYFHMVVCLCRCPDHKPIMHDTNINKNVKVMITDGGCKHTGA